MNFSILTAKSRLHHRALKGLTSLTFGLLCFSPIGALAGTATLLAPANNASYSAPANIALTTSLVATNVSQINKVVFYQGATEIAETTALTWSGNSRRASLTWSNAPAGNYSISAHGVYPDGTELISPVISISVTNPPLFTCGFESVEGFSVGNVNTQTSWAVPYGTANVQDDASAPAGTRTLSIAAGGSAKRSLGTNLKSSLTFFDIYAKPVAGSSMYHATQLIIGGAMVTLIQNGTNAEVYTGTYGSYYDDNNQYGTGHLVPITSAGVSSAWLRFTLRYDPTVQKWDLYLNGHMIWYDAQIGNPLNTDFIVYNSGSSAAQIDALSLSSDNPLFADADKDGIDDAYELVNGMDISKNDRYGDVDGDGLTNIEEYLLGTRANVADTDGDGMSDYWEVYYGFNPLVSDALLFNSDSDHDGLTYLAELMAGTNPNIADTDGDGMSDGLEVSLGLNPLLSDVGRDDDHDGVTNIDEVNRGTDPLDFYNGQSPVITKTPLAPDFQGGEFRISLMDSSANPLPNAPITVTIPSGLFAFKLSPLDSGSYTSAAITATSDGTVKIFIQSRKAYKGE